NSTLFNASRIFGPAVAGALLVAGVGICFLVNAISFLAVLIGLLAMRVSDFFPLEEFERPRILAGTREGLTWIRRQPRMLALLAGAFLFLAGAGFTAWSANSNAIMQLAAPDRLRGRVIGLYFYAFNGTGAIAGLMTGWLCDIGGTELAFAVSGIIGLVAVCGT